MAALATLPPSANPVETAPLRYGAVVYHGFQALDLFGPLDALNTLSHYYPLELAILAETLEPVSTIPPSGDRKPSIGQSILPTHTFANAPEIDVLLVPGGIGDSIATNIAPAVEYITKVYPSLKFVVTVCTGAVVVAQAGVLDGRRATSNKKSLDQGKIRPQVNWVPRARWVVDGNIWTSSGVSAGLDLIFALIAQMYGEDVADMISDILEYERHRPHGRRLGPTRRELIWSLNDTIKQLKPICKPQYHYLLEE